MSRIRKTVFPENLYSYKVFVEDNAEFSQYFNISELPDIFAGGKSAFLIQGSEFLVPSTPVKVELLDVNGNTIFLQPIKNFQEGLYRAISVEVYEDTPPGPPLLTIMGEISQTIDGVPVPIEWKGKFNVRWQKTVSVQPSTINSAKIRLYNTPTITAREILVPYRQEMTASIVTLMGTALPNISKIYTEAGTFNTYYLVNSSFPFINDMRNGNVYYYNLGKEIFDQPTFTPSHTNWSTYIDINFVGNIATYSASSGAGSILPNWTSQTEQFTPFHNYRFEIILQNCVAGNSSLYLTDEGLLNINIPITNGTHIIDFNFNYLFDSGSGYTPYLFSTGSTGYFEMVKFSSNQINNLVTSSIIDILNSSFLQVDFIPEWFETSNTITMEYKPITSYVQTSYSRSLAEVTVNNLTTFSGDVARARIYAKSAEDGTPYQLIDDVRIENIKLLNTSSLSTGDRNFSIGKLSSQNIIDSYWISGIATSTGYSNFSDLIVSQSNSRLINGGVLIYG